MIESVNKLVRKYLPKRKGMVFNQLKNDTIKEIEDKINHYSNQVLNFKSAFEGFRRKNIAFLKFLRINTNMKKSNLQSNHSKENTNRFLEIDFLRSIAILLMFVYHFVIDLYFLDINRELFRQPIFIYWNDICFNLFFFIVGISLTIAYRKSIFLEKSTTLIFKTIINRGLKHLAYGLIVTIATFFVMRSNYVLFGTLHFIACSIIIAFPFLKFKKLNLVFAFLCFIIGTTLRTIHPDHSWLASLGIYSTQYTSIDFFPFFSNFPTILIGVAAGNFFTLLIHHKINYIDGGILSSN